jgi:hypothetical protein
MMAMTTSSSIRVNPAARLEFLTAFGSLKIDHPKIANRHGLAVRTLRIHPISSELANEIGQSMVIRSIGLVTGYLVRVWDW